mmetsp:Transcript_73934/g.171517  ORF Transcript_73934/g.171517 Transcript_73934/m.171517 type:complete len:98 (-) Transcript_73934:1410-1703(-)
MKKTLALCAALCNKRGQMDSRMISCWTCNAEQREHSRAWFGAASHGVLQAHERRAAEGDGEKQTRDASVEAGLVGPDEEDVGENLRKCPEEVQGKCV